MPPDPSIVARLLALPIDARRRLVEQGGYGWWVGPGIIERICEYWPRPDALPHGWAWYPDRESAWLKAAAGERRWVIHRGGAMISGQEDSYPTAEDCALSWFEAGN